MNIPLVNLVRQYKEIQKTVDHAILAVCKKSDFILGDEVATFEREFAEYLGVRYCVGVASGTDAIKLMTIAAGIGPGDEVIVQANTFISTVLPLIELGAKPVFIDCDPETGQIDVQQTLKKITKRTKAILPVHLYGHPAPMEELRKLLKSYPLTSKPFLLEDAAQAHGSSIAGKKCGSLGDIAAFSFYPGKNLGAYGDGGAVVTDNAKFAEKLRILRNIGQKKKYDHVILGTNSRLDTIQAALLSVKLKHLDAWNKKRLENALMLSEALQNVGDISPPDSMYNRVARVGAPPPAGVPFVDGREGNPVTGPHDEQDIRTNFHLYVIRTKKRNALLKHLESRGIHCGIHYPVPLHLTPALKFLGYKIGDFPASELRAKTMLTLPMYAELTPRELRHIISSIKEFYS